jgi:hypothetical protein
MLATGEYVWKKSTPNFCLKPFATNRALYRTTWPCSFRFLANTHRHPIGRAPDVRRTRVQEPLSECAFNSGFIALIHSDASLLFIACWYVVGASSASPTLAA